MGRFYGLELGMTSIGMRMRDWERSHWGRAWSPWNGAISLLKVSVLVET